MTSDIEAMISEKKDRLLGSSGSSNTDGGERKREKGEREGGRERERDRERERERERGENTLMRINILLTTCLITVSPHHNGTMSNMWINARRERYTM